MNITEIATAILPNVMEIIGTIAMFMAAKIGIPWLREQRIFSLVRKLVKGAEKSPSSRRAWIEIRISTIHRKEKFMVALLAEGVDRNRTSTLWSTSCSR